MDLCLHVISMLSVGLLISLRKHQPAMGNGQALVSDMVIAVLFCAAEGNITQKHLVVMVVDCECQTHQPNHLESTLADPFATWFRR